MAASDFGTRARFVEAAIADLDADVRSGIGSDIEYALTACRVVERAYKQLADTKSFLFNRVAEAMPNKRIVVEGEGVFERHAERAGKPKCFDEEGLWRHVLDHRHVNPVTAEVLPQAEVIRRIYGAESRETGWVRLTGASPAKLEALGIDWETFFEKADFDGWSLKVPQ